MIKSNGEYSVTEYLTRVLDVNGNGTGTTDAIGDYSGTGLGETIFYVQPPPGQIFIIDRLLTHVEDVGTFVPNLYGRDIVLTAGIRVNYIKNSITTEITNAHFIHSNSEWAMFCYDQNIDEKGGAGTNFMHVRWSFNKSEEIVLNGNTSDKFQVILNDDFTGLVQQHFVVEGKH